MVAELDKARAVAAEVLGGRLAKAASH